MKNKKISVEELNKIDELEVELILEDHFNEGEGVFLSLTSKSSPLEEIEKDMKFYSANEKNKVDEIIKEFDSYYLNDDESMLYLESDSYTCRIELV